MKNSIYTSLLVLVFSLSTSTFAGGRDSGGGTPFVLSIEKITTIQEDERVWKNVFGPIHAVRLIAQLNALSTYEISTLEPLPILDSQGRTIGYKKVLCTFKAAVEYVDNADGVGGKIYVRGDIDFSQCPSIALKN